MSTQNIAFPKAEMSDTSDKESADHAQFVHLFARDNQRIFAFIYSLLPSWADAQDVFQQTSLILWNEFDKFDQTRDFTAWANGIAFNTIRNFRRSRVRKQLVFSDDLMSTLADERVHCTMNSDSRREALDECLRKLPSSDRTLVQQVYEDETTIRDHAEQVGLAVQTIYNRLNIIRQNLVKCIDRTLAIADLHR